MPCCPHSFYQSTFCLSVHIMFISPHSVYQSTFFLSVHILFFSPHSVYQSTFCLSNTAVCHIHIHQTNSTLDICTVRSLWLLACWDCEFESSLEHGYLSVVTLVCCQVSDKPITRPEDYTVCGTLCAICHPHEYGGPLPLIGPLPHAIIICNRCANRCILKLTFVRATQSDHSRRRTHPDKKKTRDIASVKNALVKSVLYITNYTSFVVLLGQVYV